MGLKGLVERYFYEPLEAEKAESDKEQARLLAAASFMRSDYFPEFRSHLESMRRANEPKPGGEGTMLYQCGVRDGIDLVLNHLNALTEQIRMSRDE